MCPNPRLDIRESLEDAYPNVILNGDISDTPAIPTTQALGRKSWTPTNLLRDVNRRVPTAPSAGSVLHPARNQRPTEQTEVVGVHDVVAIEVGTLDDRPIGVPDADQKPEVEGIDLDTPVEIAEAGDRRRFGFVA